MDGLVKLEFTHCYPYRALGPDHSPVVPLHLSFGDFEVGFRALVDTGASFSLFSGMHLRHAGLDLLGGEPRTFHGFMGVSALGYRHRARLALAGRELDLDLHFAAGPLARQVVGRDVLEHFLLGLRDKASELYLAADPLG